MSGGHLQTVRPAGQERDSWVIVVCKAGRAAVARALLADPPLPAIQLRIVLAVVDLTVLWSKLEDEVSLGELIDRVGIGGKPEDQRKYARKALKNLVDLGVITYSPGNGRGRTTRVGVPAALAVAPEEDEKLSLEKGGKSYLKGGGIRTGNGGEIAPEKGGNLHLKRGGWGPPHPKGSRDLPKNPEGADEPEIRAGVEVQEMPDGHRLLAAVAAAAPAGWRHQLLDEPEQVPGRVVLRRRLVDIAALVGPDAAVAIVAGEWPPNVASAMAHVNARARAFLAGGSGGSPRTSAPPAPDPLDGIADATLALAERARAREAELAGEPRAQAPDFAAVRARLQRTSS